MISKLSLRIDSNAAEPWEAFCEGSSTPNFTWDSRYSPRDPPQNGDQDTLFVQTLESVTAESNSNQWAKDLSL